MQRSHQHRKAAQVSDGSRASASNLFCGKGQESDVHYERREKGIRVRCRQEPWIERFYSTSSCMPPERTTEVVLFLLAVYHAAALRLSHSTQLHMPHSRRGFQVWPVRCRKLRLGTTPSHARRLTGGPRPRYRPVWTHNHCPQANELEDVAGTPFPCALHQAQIHGSRSRMGDQNTPPCSPSFAFLSFWARAFVFSSLCPRCTAAASPARPACLSAARTALQQHRSSRVISPESCHLRSRSQDPCTANSPLSQLAGALNHRQTFHTVGFLQRSRPIQYSQVFLLLPLELLELLLNTTRPRTSASLTLLNLHAYSTLSCEEHTIDSTLGQPTHWAREC